MQFMRINVLLSVESEQSAMIAMTVIMKYNTYVDRLFLDYYLWLNTQQQCIKCIRTGGGKLGRTGMRNKYITVLLN